MSTTTARRSAMAPGLRLSIVEGCVAMVPQTLTTGVFLTGFALMLGAEPWAIGLLAAVPAIAQAGQLLSPLLMAKGVDRKRLTVWAASLGRYMWAPMIAVPFLPIAPDARLLLFFVLLAASALLAQMSGVAWTDWMSELVPASERGRYFGLRAAVCATVGIGVTAAGSRFLDAFAPGDRPWAFLGLGGAVLIASLASQLILFRQPEPAARPPRRTASGRPFGAPLSNRGFMRLTGWMVGWTFVSNLTGGFCYAYALKELHAGYALVGQHALVVSALAVVSGPLWGRLIDRRGAQFALAVAVVPLSLHPIYWFVMRPEFLQPIWADAVSSGIFWSGLNLAVQALMMEAAPSGERAAYVGVYNAATGGAIALAAVLGGVVLSLGAGARIEVAGAALSVWQLLLLVGTLARATCATGLVRLPRVAAPTLQIDTWVAVTVPARAADAKRDAAGSGSM